MTLRNNHRVSAACRIFPLIFVLATSFPASAREPRGSFHRGICGSWNTSGCRDCGRNAGQRPTYKSALPSEDLSRCTVMYDFRISAPPRQIRLTISPTRGEAIFFEKSKAHQYEWFEEAPADHAAILRSLELLELLGRSPSIQSARHASPSPEGLHDQNSEMLSLQCEGGPRWTKDLLLLPSRTEGERSRLRQIRHVITEAIQTARKRSPTPFPEESKQPNSGTLEGAPVSGEGPQP